MLGAGLASPLSLVDSAAVFVDRHISVVSLAQGLFVCSGMFAVVSKSLW